MEPFGRFSILQVTQINPPGLAEKQYISTEFKFESQSLQSSNPLTAAVGRDGHQVGVGVGVETGVQAWRSSRTQHAFEDLEPESTRCWCEREYQGYHTRRKSVNSKAAFWGHRGNPIARHGILPENADAYSVLASCIYVWVIPRPLCVFFTLLLGFACGFFLGKYLFSSII